MRKSYLFTVTSIALIFVIIVSNNISFPSNAAGCSSANIFVVQCTGANTNGTIATSGTTSTITVHAGNSLIIVGGFASSNVQNSALSCSDNLGQTYTTIIQQNQNPNSGLAQNSIICYKTNTVGGADAFTVTINSAAQGVIVVAGYEVIPSLQFTGIISETCKSGLATNCVGGTTPGQFCTPSPSFPANWPIGISNASLVLSVMGGSPIGTDDSWTGTGFAQIVTTNVNSAGDGNFSQIIAEGNGAYNNECLPILSHWYSGVAAAFGPFMSTTTVLTTLTVTAWNTIDPGTPINWITLALFLTLIPGLMWGALRGFGARPSATVFFTLVSCFIGSIMGTISGVDLGVNAIVPLGITVFNGIALGLYVILSRQRGNPVT